MSSIFDKNEFKQTETKSVTPDQSVTDEVEKPVQTVESMIDKIKTIDVSSGEKIVFDNVSVVEFNQVYKAFNRQHFKPRYNHEKKQLHFP